MYLGRTPRARRSSRAWANWSMRSPSWSTSMATMLTLRRRMLPRAPEKLNASTITVSPSSSRTSLISSMASPDPDVIRISSTVVLMPRWAASLSTRNCRSGVMPWGPPSKLYMDMLRGSPRNTLSADSMNPSTGTMSGSLCPPMKLYLGWPSNGAGGAGRVRLNSVE